MQDPERRHRTRLHGEGVDRRLREEFAPVVNELRRQLEAADRYSGQVDRPMDLAHDLEEERAANIIMAASNGALTVE